MPKKLELKNKKFGSLLVLSECKKRKNGNVMWLCRCDCGRLKKASGRELKAGITISCGCWKVLWGKTKNTKLLRKGERFTRLEVLSKTEKRDSGGNIIWKCLCDCGRVVFTIQNRLKSGVTKSCGCYSTDLATRRIIEFNKKSRKLPPEAYLIKSRNRMESIYLTNNYIKSLLDRNRKIRKFLTDDIIQMKRTQISMFRELKKSKALLTNRNM